MWISLAIISMVFLGFYEISKKHALSRNAVTPVLLLTTTFGSAIFIPVIVRSFFLPELSSNAFLAVSSISPKAHLFILLKTTIVAFAWLLSYGAFKHLPISIAAPFSTLSPIFTIIGATIIFSERLSVIQYAGITIVLAAYYLLSRISTKEGIHFLKNKWILALLCSALLNATSALYDKFLIPRIGATNVQAWFSVYMVVILLPVHFLLRFSKNGNSDPFTWRWSIPLVGILLVAADFAYFRALADRQALIAVIETTRRGNVAIAFAAGSLFFREPHLMRKGAAVLSMLIGIALLFGASYAGEE